MIAIAGCGGDGKAAVRIGSEVASSSDEAARLFPQLPTQRGGGATAIERGNNVIFEGLSPAVTRRAPTLAERVQTTLNDAQVVNGIREIAAEVICGALSTIVDEGRYPSTEEWITDVASGLVGLIADDSVADWIAGAVGTALSVEVAQALDPDGDNLIELDSASEAYAEFRCSQIIGS
jgi:hypothetical protein